MTTTAPNTIKWTEVLNWIRDRYLHSPRNSPFKRDWKVFNKEWCLFSSYTTEKALWYFFYNNFQFDITNTVLDHEGRFIISEHKGNDDNLYKDNFISEMHTFFMSLLNVICTDIFLTIMFYNFILIVRLIIFISHIFVKCIYQHIILILKLEDSII
jgi:hypothetical protein